MIIEDIKNSIRKALYDMDNNIIFHFEEMEHTDFPCAKLSLKDFKIIPNTAYNRQKCDFSFELVFMKSEDNKIIELLNCQKMLSDALLPTLKINSKKITLDEVSFSIVNKKLIMLFKLSFYTYQKDETETMQTLDITIKEDKNAR